MLYIRASALETIETQGTPDEKHFLFSSHQNCSELLSVLKRPVSCNSSYTRQLPIFSLKQTICSVLKVQSCCSLGEDVCIVCIISTAACGRSQGESVQGYLLETGSRDERRMRHVLLHLCLYDSVEAAECISNCS